MASVLLKPRWLIGHLLVVLFSLVFIGLGFWQLNRHDDQRLANALLEQAQSAPITDLEAAGRPLSGLYLTRVALTGTYDYSRQLERRPRTVEGRIGFDAVVPLVADSVTVLVNRGFIPDENAPAAVPIREGEVRITGWLRMSQARSSLGPQNPPTGDLSTIARIDIERLEPQFAEGLFPGYLDLISESPSPGGVPTLLPEPITPSNRPNLIYAYQWFAFAGIASVGWFLYLRKQFFVAR